MKLPPIYQGNDLIERLGSLLSDEQIAVSMTNLPPVPTAALVANALFAQHESNRISEIFIPTRQQLAVGYARAHNVRAGYRHRIPGTARTLQMLTGKAYGGDSDGSSLISSISGLPGSGKTRTAKRSFLQFEGQVILHDSFPGIVGPFKQLVSLVVNVPGSGLLWDLVIDLMRETDEVLDSNEFADYLERKTRGAPLPAFQVWAAYARRHFLGALVLDEVQNFFRQQTLAMRRRSSRGRPNEKTELRLVEDQALKSVLSLSNHWNIPVQLSMTPDGLNAFSTRSAMSQRLVADGYFQMEIAESENDPFTKKTLLPTLAKYQYLPQKLIITDEVRSKLWSLTAFERRTLLTLWKLSHRIAFAVSAKGLTMHHFDLAMDRHMAPVKPAIEALKSRDANRLRLFQDMVPKNDFWEQFEGDSH